MTETEKKALALVNEVRRERGLPSFELYDRTFYTEEALCRAIKQHEAFRQEVSDAVVEYFDPEPWNCERAKRTFSRFILPKPDPLVEALIKGGIVNHSAAEMAADLRAAIEARGGRIVWEGE